MFTSDTEYIDSSKYQDKKHKTLVLDSYEIIEDEEGVASSHRVAVKEVRSLQTAVTYLIISIALMLFGAVYEYFGHGVFSFYMIYAFAIPLLGGALPYMTDYIRRLRTAASHGGSGGSKFTMLIRTPWMYHAGLATLTVGSIMKGVLDIYGTTNSLTIAYPVAGALLIAISFLIKPKHCLS